MKTENLFNQSKFDLYKAYLKSTGISNASIKRKLSSLATFQKYLVKKGLNPNPTLSLDRARVSSSPALSREGFRKGFNLKNKSLFTYLLLASLLIISSAVGYGFYRQSIKNAKSGMAYSTAASPVFADRFLSFQGRLTDSAGNPITSSTSIRFDLFDTETVGTGTSLYTSASGNSQVVVPDENGIFSVTIGKTHGTEIPNSVFTENAAVWLQITAGGETMDPRQPIATVAYALNAETLQGLPPSASGLKDTVLVIDGTGNLNLGETSPTIKSTSGTLGIEGQAVLIKASDGSGGNIEINPDANGIIKLTTEGSGSTAVNGFIDATNANLSTGNLYSATIRNTNRGYNFLSFKNYDTGTTNLSTRFSIDAYGNTLIGGTMTATNISIGNTLLTTSAYRLNLFDSISPTAGSLLYGNGSKIVNTGVGTSGQILMSNATGAPVWINANATGIGTTYAAGNGLTLSSNTFKLGGTFTENTNLDLSSYSLNFLSTGTTLASFTSSQNTFYNPTSFVSSGDVSMAYDLNFTNATSATIRSSSPLYIQTESPYANLDINLTAANDGIIYLNSNSEITKNLTIGGTFVSVGSTNLVTNLNADLLDGYHASHFLSVGDSGTFIYTASAGITQVGNDFRLNQSYSPTWTGLHTFSAGATISDLSVTNKLSVGSTAYFASSVGIGTTSPGQKLSVIGNGSFSTSLSVGTTLTTNTLNATRAQTTTVVTNLNADLLDGQHANYFVNIGQTAPFITTLTAGTDINITGTGVGRTISNTSTLSTVTGRGASTSTMLSLLGGAYFGSTNQSILKNDGSVGIGTTNPSAKLQIVGGLSASNILTLSRNDGSAQSNDFSFLISNSSGNNGSLILKPSTNADIAFSTVANGNTPVLTIKSNNGNVGIGTTNPGHKLDVIGDGSFSTNLSVGGTLTLPQGANSGYLLTSDASGNASWIAPSGIGGTDTLSAGTDISITSSGVGRTISNTSTLSTVTGRGASTSTMLSLLGGAYFGSTNQSILKNDGSVGIGTTNPQNKLEIYRTDAWTTTEAITFGMSTAEPSINLYRPSGDGTTARNWQIQNYNQNLFFNHNSTSTAIGNETLTTYLAISNIGNVGIGTTNPTSKLTINNASYSGNLLRLEGSENSKYNLKIDNFSTTGVVGYSFNLTNNSTTYNNNLVLDRGNVGIGTTAPAEKLDVNGKIAINGVQTIYNADALDSIEGSLFIGNGGSNQPIRSTSVGINALLNATGQSNTAMGYQSLKTTTTGGYNSAFGRDTLYSNTTGSNNTAISFYSLYSNTTGSANIALGDSSLYSNKTGSYGVAIGVESQRYANDTTTPWTNSNTSIGYQALRGSATAANNTGTANTAIGYQSLINNSSGGNNSTLGVGALYANTSGSHNLAIGRDALAQNTTGNYNVALGNYAGSYTSIGNNQTSSSSTYIGYYAKALADAGTNEIVIGYNAIGNGSNSATLGNDSITKTILKGNVGIGTTSPTQKLTINNGNALISNWGSAQDLTTDTYEKGLTITGGNMRLILDTSSVSNGGAYIQVRHKDTAYPTNTYPLSLQPVGGNVGIGTTAPSKKLDVIGNGSFSTNLSVGGTLTLPQGASSGYLLTSDGSGNASWIAPAGVGGTDVLTAGQGITITSVGVGRTISLNLGSANTWTAIQNFSVGATASALSTTGNLSVGNSLAVTGRSTFANQVYVSNNGIGVTGNSSFSNNLAVGGTFVSVGSTNTTTNLSSDYLDGYDSSSFGKLATANTWTAIQNFSVGATASNLTVTGNGSITNNLSVGKTLTTNTLNATRAQSTTVVTNLNADLLDGYHASSFIYTAGNGLTLASQQFKLGGTLSENTDIGFSGYALTFSDGGSTFASFSAANNTFYNPTTFMSSGDVSMAYDLNFTNSTSATIRSSSPLYIQTESPYANLDINLTAANSGKIYLNSDTEITKNLNVGGTLTLPQGAASGYLLQSDTSGNASWVNAVGIGGTDVLTAGGGISITSVGVGRTISVDYDTTKLTLTGNKLTLNLGATNVWTALQTFTNGIGVSGTANLTNALNVGGTGYFASYIGIGTTTPNIKLHISQNGVQPTSSISLYSGTQLALDASSGDNFINFRNTADNGTYQGMIFTDNNHAGYIVNKNAGGVYSDSLLLGGYGAIYLQVSSNGTVAGKTDVMTLKSGGNVGIGTTNPTKKLDVIGDGSFSTNLTVGGTLTTNDLSLGATIPVADNNIVLTQTAAGGLVQAIDTSAWDKNASNDYASWNLQANGAGTTAVLSGSTVNFVNGVGISLSQTGSAITINSTGGVGTTYVAGNGLTLSSGTFKLGGALTEATRLNIGSTEVLYFSTAANVGIGTTNPLAKLDVNGKIAINGAQTIYNASALNGFTDSLFIGDGGGSLSHTTGNEGYYNTGVGGHSLYSVTTGSFNLAIGSYALGNNTTGSNNLAFGADSQLGNIDGNNNIGLGFRTLYSNQSGDDNTAIGASVLIFNTGDKNTGIGAGSMYYNSTGYSNTGIGYGSLSGNSTGNQNTGIGDNALTFLGAGSNNVALGFQAGKYTTVGALTSSDNSVFLGTNSGALGDGQTNQIAIGYDTAGNGSNSATLGNDSITKTILKGNLGLGTTNPTYKLSVIGDGYFSTNLTIGGTFVSVGSTNLVTNLNANYLNGYAYNTLPYVNDATNTTLTRSGTGPYTLGLNLGNTNVWTALQTFTNGIGVSGTANLTNALNVGGTGYFASRVGIGTSSPSSLLEISDVGNTGSINWSGTIRNPSNANVTSYGAGLKLKISSDVSNEINKWAGIAAIAGTGYSNRTDMAFYSNPTAASAPIETMRLTGSGYLGLGTTNPTAKLTVIGNGSFSTALSVGTSLSVGSNLSVGATLAVTGRSTFANQIYVSNGGVGVTGDSSFSNNLSVGGTGYFASYVGIGTTAPGSKLEIRSSSSAVLKLVNDEALYNTAQQTNIDFWGRWYSSSPTSLIQHASIKGLAYQDGYQRGELAFYTNTDGVVSEKMRIAYSGNIGIGTTAPLAPLHIGTTASASVGGQTLASLSAILTGSIASPKFYDSDNSLYFIDPAVNDSNYNSLSLAPQGSIKFNVTDATGASKYISAYAASRIQGFTTGLSLDVGTSASIGVGNTVVWNSGLFLSTGGYVGIGTTNPTAKLEIGGAASVISNTAGDITINSASNNISFSGDNLINITNGIFAGNVGIGTTKPGYKLDVHTGTDYNLAVTSTGTAYLNLASVNDAHNAYTKLALNGSSIILNNETSGNVGIGTTNPGTKLDVVGSIRASNSPSGSWGDIIGGSFNSNTTYAYNSICVGNSSGVCDAAAGTVIGIANTLAVNNIPNSGNVFFNSGNVGIGTASPQKPLHINSSSTNSIIIRSQANSADANTVLEAQGTYRYSLGIDGNSLWQYYTDSSNVARYITTTGTAIDLAEWYPVGSANLDQNGNSNLKKGQLLCIDPSDTEKVVACSATAKNLIGIVSTNPYQTMGMNDLDDNHHNATQLALIGRVPLIVTLQNNQQIKNGDSLTSSNFKGIATKAIQAGPIAAKSLESTNWSSQACPSISSIDQINWPTDDGFNSSRPCYTLSDGTIVGKIMAFVNVSYYDPDLTLTSTGQININYNISDEVLASLGYDGTKNEIESASYSLTDSLGNTVTRISQFGQIAAVKIRAGLVSTTNLIADNAIIKNLKTKKIETDEIVSPVADIDFITSQNIQSTQVTTNNLVASDIQTTQITTEDLIATNIETQDLTSDNLTSKEATISTLYADNIISKDGTFGDIMAAKISALRDELTSIVANNEDEATPSAIASQSDNWAVNITADSATIEGNLNLTDNLVIGANLMINGDTQMGNAFVTGQFSVGNITIADNYIQTMDTAFYIQPNNTGSVHIMGDTLIISDTGDVRVNGNLTVTGSLFANLLDAAEIRTQKLTAAEINSDKINIATDSASTIIADSNETNIATSSAQINSNATAGTATLPANTNQITISTNKLTANSMIYLTPVGSTNNQVIYVKEKTDTYFTIALDSALDHDISINWWIIN